MGFSVSASTGIIFLGLLISASIFAPAVEEASEQVSEEFDQKGDRLLAQQNTAFSITNATYNTTSETLKFSIENTGTVTLGVNETDVLLDGIIQSGYTTSINGETDREIWTPEETMNVTIENVNEPNRIKVVSETGISEATTDITVVS